MLFVMVMVGLVRDIWNLLLKMDIKIGKKAQ